MTPLRPGDPAPWFVGATSANPQYVFASTAGRYVALCFVDSSRSPAGRAMQGLIATRRALFDDATLALFGVTADAEDREQVVDDLPGVRWFHDPAREIAGQFGLVQGADEGTWLILDPTLRVVAVGGLAQLAQLGTIAAQLPPVALHAGVEISAPVLLTPRVFEPDFCRRLIALYEAQGGHERGFMVERDGKTVEVADHAFKRRADHVMEDAELRRACLTRISRRLAPEIQKAFQFKATRMERYLIGRYDSAVGGHFRPHRDNTTKGTAHRRFAVTLNLNAEAYEGGELVFPEFGPKRYKPPTGGAVVFSCSLMHEATPVTRGVRYAFLPFLYDEEAARLREQNNPHLHESVDRYRPETLPADL